MLYRNEDIYKKEFPIIAGVDEAGRGPLAGPVIVAAVILNESIKIIGLNDSKKLSAQKREFLFDQIIEIALDYKIEIIPVEVIDEINILQASLLGMERACNSLKIKPDLCLIDGNRIPKNMKYKAEAIIKGDGKLASIAAASILAKVTRDRIMIELHQKYPEYNFLKNKGYPTRDHIAAINEFGILDCHRKTFSPIKQLVFKF
ncbi:MAG: ribonuclease HII [Candidatus Cloacimonadales bacterium]|nr:ribonuclease HII [Candidatus Cloacimonadales bacterium]